MCYVCKCVMYCCHRVSTQLRLNISYIINKKYQFNLRHVAMLEKITLTPLVKTVPDLRNVNIQPTC
jgi:hypothetical protein